MAEGASKKKKKKKRRFSIVRFILSLIGCLICLGIMACSVGAVFLAMYVVEVTADDDGTLDLDNQKNKQTSILYDRYSEEYASLSGDENRIWRELSAIPEDLQHAVIAIEDKGFYEEPGINIKRTIGAALNEFTHNGIYGSQQGASTIEQQLIKNLTQDRDTDVMRKVREIFRALGLAKRYSKETVLEAYLNTIPLTGRVCGMEAGALEYFGKHVEELTLAECATLASITKNPTRYNPFTNPEILRARRNQVLYEMWQQGYISESTYRSTAEETIVITEKSASVENSTRTSSNSWFTDAVYEELMKDIMQQKGLTRAEAQEEVFSGGLRVYTTVDPKVQDAVEQVMYNENDEFFPALWTQQEVESWIPKGEEITYDEDGMPLNPDGTQVFTKEDVPVYIDEENHQFKTGIDETGEYICFYETVRTQAAMAVLNYDGEVVGIAGGLGEKTVDRGTNRATLPHQTGSTMKPIGAYCLALDYKLITYSSPEVDTPLYSREMKKVLDTDRCRKLGLPLDPWSAVNLARDDVWRDWPTNYGGAGGKGATMLVYDALRQSYNTVAVQIGSMVGAEYIFNFAHDTLQCSYLDPEHDVDLAPIVLGSQTYGITPVELAGAYQIFYDGSFTSPHYYTEVYDYQGNIYLDNTKRITTTQAISKESAYIMNRMMYNVLYTQAGTATGMAPAGDMEAVAKTGTTTEYKDYTFGALTPYYVTTVWWGFDKPTDMYSLGGKNGKPTQLAFKKVMELAQEGLPYKEFPMPETVITRNFSGSGAVTNGGGNVGYYTEDNLPNVSQAIEDDYAAAAAAAAAGFDPLA